MKKTFPTAVFFCIAFTNAQSNDCVEVIKASKLQSKTVDTESVIQTHASTFCKLYVENSGSTRSSDYGLSYKALSASMSDGRTNVRSVYDYYCDQKNMGYAKDTFYELYTQQVAPGAFSAYKQCLNLYSHGLKVDFNNSILANSITFTIGYQSPGGGNTADVSFVTSPDVKCRWRGESKRKFLVTIESQHSKTLSCTRKDHDHPSSVRISRDSAADQYMALKWHSYLDGKIPFNDIEEFNNKSQEKVDQLKELYDSMNGAVVAFAAEECPEGFGVEYVPAYGRFIRGIDHSGDGKWIDPDKKRKPGSLQDDALQNHQHSFSYHLGGNVAGGGQNMELNSANNNMRVGDPQNARVANETRPKNVALLYCIKN